MSFSVLAGMLVAVVMAPGFVLTSLATSSAVGVYKSLPEFLELGELRERNEIYAGSSAGPVRIATVYQQNREEVVYEQISVHALNAAIDGEDRRFYEHGGVDVQGVVRAVVDNLRAGGVESGASTLSMQVVKNSFINEAMELPTPEEQKAAYDEAIANTLDRKLKEMKLAIGLEKKYTKKEILVAYLNMSNFGDATYGIQAAAQRYFGVNAWDLTPVQAASLVAIVQEPSARHLADPENWVANQERRDVILEFMLDAGHLTQEEYDAAIATPVDENFVQLQPPINGCRAAVVEARWFCDFVLTSIEEFAFLGETPDARRDAWNRGGWKLYTTLDLDLQRVAQNALWAYAPNNETGFALGGASTSVQPGTGRVLTMAENKVFDDDPEQTGVEFSAVNYNTDFLHGGSSGVQPGSTYKLFTLLTWLEAGKGVEERLSANPTGFPANTFRACGERLGGEPWEPNNASNERGTYSIRAGTVQSINGVYARMAQQLDLCNIRDMAARLGVVRADGNELGPHPSSIIGTDEVTPLSMAGAYAAVAALGTYCTPILIDSVVTPEGDEQPGQQAQCRQVLDPGIAATAIDVLEQVMNVSNTAYANPDDGVPIFGKTGTTDRSNQTWMASATSKVATVVWVGNSVGERDITTTAYNGVRGILLRHYITRDIMAAANAKYGGDAWPAPPRNLLRSTGVYVPDGMAGLPLDQARGAIERAGLGFADGGQTDSELPAGQVVATDPAGGTIVPRDTTITVFTSNGALQPPPSSPDPAG
ncbi:MAG TPA: transglycosylase domain-containing protein [Rhodoglobus sp.]|nr:transglycosylase domain-containing protein [Rhodoglobus sp.]